MDSILDFIIRNIGLFMRSFINFATAPLLKIIKFFIPDFSSYFSVANNFIINYVFKGFQFVKMIFINLTNLNHTVFLLLVGAFVILLYFSSVLLVLKLAYNAWQVFHGTQRG